MIRHRDQRGASLLIMLFLTALVGTLAMAVLSMSLSGAGATRVVRDDRGRAAVAVAGLEAAVQSGRTARWVGRVGLSCPTLSLTVGADSATVTCTSATGPYDLDRTLTYQSSVRGSVLARATVIFRDSTAGAGEPAVDVVSWTSGPAV